jgi:acyl carrier protein
MESTKDIIRSFIDESFLPGSSNSGVEESASFLDMGLIDSTGVLELVDFLEEQFGISVEDTELIPENLDSISNLCRYLESKGVPASC